MSTEELASLAKRLLRQKHFQGIAWMACHPDRYHALDVAYRELYHDGKLHPSMMSPDSKNLFGLFCKPPFLSAIFDYLPDIDVERILSDGKEGGDGNYPGVYWVRKMRLDDPKTLPQTFAILEKILDERLISRFVPKHTSTDGILSGTLVLADIGQTLVHGRALLDRAEQVRSFDQGIEDHPGVRKAMQTYWKQRYWEKSGRKHGRLSHDLIRDILGGGVYMSPRQDDLDLSISLGRGWIIDEIKQNTPVGKEALKRIEKGYELHWFLCDLSPSRAGQVIRTLAGHLGHQWRDPDGRNIAHCLMAHANPPKRSALISLASMPEFTALFLTPDNRGEVPLDMVRRIKRWGKHQDLVSKLARKVMSARAMETSGTVKARQKPGAVRL